MGTVRVHVACEDRPPFEVDAIAIEDDTYSVLAADPAFHEPTEHPIRLWTAVHDAERAEPGTVSVRSGRPPKLLAVVHDLSQDPTWKAEWVARALGEIVRRTDELSIRSLGLQVLGAVHGRLPLPSFVDLLREALEHRPPTTLQRVWLISPPSAVDQLEHLLQGKSFGRPV